MQNLSRYHFKQETGLLNVHVHLKTEIIQEWSPLTVSNPSGQNLIKEKLNKNGSFLWRGTQCIRNMCPVVYPVLSQNGLGWHLKGKRSPQREETTGKSITVGKQHSNTFPAARRNLTTRLLFLLLSLFHYLLCARLQGSEPPRSFHRQWPLTHYLGLANKASLHSLPSILTHGSVTDKWASPAILHWKTDDRRHSGQKRNITLKAVSRTLLRRTFRISTLKVESKALKIAQKNC